MADLTSLAGLCYRPIIKRERLRMVPPPFSGKSYSLTDRPVLEQKDSGRESSAGLHLTLRRHSWLLVTSLPSKLASVCAATACLSQKLPRSLLLLMRKPTPWDGKQEVQGHLSGEGHGVEYLPIPLSPSQHSERLNSKYREKMSKYQTLRAKMAV